MKKSDYKYYIYFGLIVFIGLFIFFSFVNPLMVYDSDDWFYIHIFRKPIPSPYAWNPTRVFPETFMPIVSYLGAWIINPIVNNYFHSLTYAHSLFSSLLITLYFVQFSVLFYKRKFASVKGSIGYGCLFILLHFISHIIKGSNNTFLLDAMNLTGFYYYTLAIMINATLVMHFMSYGGVKAWLNDSSLRHKLFVVIWLYFALDSNLFASVILATYVGTDLLLTLILGVREKKFNFIHYCVNNWINILIIIYWAFTNILETMGDRADSVRKNLWENLLEVLKYAGESLVIINIFVLITEIIIFVLWYKKYRKINSTVVRFICYFGFQFIYLVLLCATVEPTYMTRAEVFLCNYFYIYIAMLACFSQLVKENRKYARIPLILVGTVCLLFIQPGKLYIPCNYSFLSYEQSEELMNDLISQVKTAEENGQTEMVLVVPEFNTDNNWPYLELIGNRVTTTLYKHKVVDTQINVTKVIFSEEKNEQYGISKDR